MANIQSNIKRNNQSKNRNLIVHAQLSAMKTYIKKAQKSCDSKDISKAYSVIDSNLSKGVIKKNKADRLKSRLSIYVSKKEKSSSNETTSNKKTRKTTTTKKSKKK